MIKINSPLHNIHYIISGIPNYIIFHLLCIIFYYFRQILYSHIYTRRLQIMIEVDNQAEVARTEQLKRFPFFNSETIKQKVPEAQNHPLTFSELSIKEIKAIYPKLYVLELLPEQSSVFVFTDQIIGSWKPHTDNTFMIQTSTKNDEGVLVTYGQDSEGQMKSTYIKLWEVQDVVDFSKIKCKKSILLGSLGNPQLSISCMYLLKDLTCLALGSRKGIMYIFQSKNLLTNDFKQSSRTLEKKQIKNVKISRRSTEIDIYFNTEDTLYWLQNLSQKRKITTQEVEAMDLSEKGTIIVAAKNDRKTLIQYDLSRQVKTWQYDGEKLLLRCFKQNYLVILTVERKSDRPGQTTQKYNLQIFDTLNYYIAHSDSFNRVEMIVVAADCIYVLNRNNMDERNLIRLIEKENAFKIQTFFKKSYFNEAWRFAKNQNSDPKILAEISRLHGDLLYSKSDFEGAIKQYILTLGHVEASYVIRRFLDVSQIQFLIQYLESIHQKHLAKKQHTALLLNCYVKQQKIQNLSTFLSQKSIQSDLFDIETAIKVCRQLNHTDLAMKLALQKKQDQLYLKILIEDKKDYDKALDYIKNSVQLEEKENFVLEFGQQLMKHSHQKLTELIELLVQAHAISIKMKERDAVLTNDDRDVLQTLNFNEDDVESLTVITFKKPDQFLRLFLIKKDEMQAFLNFLLKVRKLPNEQAVYHRLFEFYLQKILEFKNDMRNDNSAKIQEYQQKIMDVLRGPQKKYDHNHLLVIFKMYQFDQGIIYLCGLLQMRDDLLNFYISRKKDDEILQLCSAYGHAQTNLWIHALKYFAKPENNKQKHIPLILKQLEEIHTLSPLLILSILSKNKNIEYKFVKDFFLKKLQQDKNSADRDQTIINNNLKSSKESRNQYKQLKTKAKGFQSNQCKSCMNPITPPSIHFMCGHSFHQHCISSRQCIKCAFDLKKNKIDRKERFLQETNDHKRFFENLEQHRNQPFQVVSQFMGKGYFSLDILKR